MDSEDLSAPCFRSQHKPFTEHLTVSDAQHANRFVLPSSDSDLDFQLHDRLSGAMNASASLLSAGKSLKFGLKVHSRYG